jgi:Phage tail tube protein
MTIASKDKMKGSISFAGLGGGTSTVTLSATPDPETTSPVMAGNPNFKKFSEGGIQVVGPNWIKSTEFTVNNNLRMIENLGNISPVDIIPGECNVTGKSDFYFGDNVVLQKFYSGTPTSIFMSSEKEGKAVAFQFPRITYRGGTNPSASGKNTDVMMALDWSASKDTLTQAHILIDRLEYVEG